jgi:DNA-binding NarL/FixJ family response regulator
VVLGDDNVLVREGVRALLSITEGIEVVGVAEDAPTLMAAVDEHIPDVVVTDIKMPPNFRLEGIECAHEIRKRHPEVKVVILSVSTDEHVIQTVLKRGASAYIVKSINPIDLPSALGRTWHGRSLTLCGEPDRHYHRRGGRHADQHRKH